MGGKTGRASGSASCAQAAAQWGEAELCRVPARRGFPWLSVPAASLVPGPECRDPWVHAWEQRRGLRSSVPDPRPPLGRRSWGYFHGKFPGSGQGG